MRSYSLTVAFGFLEDDMVKLVALFLVLWTVLSGTAFAATLLVSPVPPGETAVSLDYSINQVRYEVPTEQFYISRDIVTLSWAHESFFASLGSIVHTDFHNYLDLDRFPLSGESGYMLAIGARGAAWRSGDFALNVHAQIHVLGEKVIAGGVSRAFKSQEILAGISAAWEPPGWRVYSGVETVPYSHIEMGVPGFEDIERSDFISLHFGGGVDIGPVFLSTDLQVGGTAGLRIGLGYSF